MTRDGKPERYRLIDLLRVAASLIDPGSPNVEYQRGICELIGRARLDIHGIGEGTGENAADIAGILDVTLKEDRHARSS